MPLSAGFAPISGPSARVLIVGSLPGRMSLERGEYYAQPQNTFWRIMGALFDAGPDMPYGRRVNRLRECRVAVWDVCRAARRPGSLDSSIDAASILPNDFATFLRDHPQIESIGFNGATAAKLYERLVLPDLPPPLQGIGRRRLPSTSPAHASVSFEDKLSEWGLLIAPVSAHRGTRR